LIGPKPDQQKAGWIRNIALNSYPSALELITPAVAQSSCPSYDGEKRASLVRVQKLKDFIHMQLPAGFPVKIEIPLFHLINARITFSNIQVNKPEMSPRKLGFPLSFILSLTAFKICHFSTILPQRRNFLGVVGHFRGVWKPQIHIPSLPEMFLYKEGFMFPLFTYPSTSF
jgi:hypothetical protein